MIEKEERILLKNVDEINESAEALKEVKIYNAMRNGIMKGKKREKRRIYTAGMGVVAAAAVAFLITYSSFELPTKGAAEHSVQTASTIDTNNFEAYRLSDRLEPGLATALEQNLVKPVGQSAENNGYRVDVTGAVTDGRKVFVLYTVQNNRDKEVMHANFRLQFEGVTDSPLQKGASLIMLASDSRIEPGQSKDFIFSTNLTPSVKYPKEVNYNVILTETSEKALQSSSNKYRTSLDIAFELNPDMLKAQTNDLKVDRILTVDGQKIKVNQVQYTPLSTYVDLEYDRSNNKQIFQLINPVLISINEGETEKLFYPSVINSDNSEVYSDEFKTTLVFRSSQSGLHGQPDSISLKAFGISAVEKDQMKIVVDLNKQQIIEAPGSNLEWVSPLPEYYPEAGEIFLRHTLDNAQYLKSNSWLAQTFTDADGQVHQRAYKTTSSGSFGGSIRSSDGTLVEEIRYNFGEDAKNYPQPLTITLEKYLNPIMDTQAVVLYSK
jgi:hypothetical protein